MFTDRLSLDSNVCRFGLSNSLCYLSKTKGANKNERSRETDNIGYNGHRKKKTNTNNTTETTKKTNFRLEASTYCKA